MLTYGYGMLRAPSAAMPETHGAKAAAYGAYPRVQQP